MYSALTLALAGLTFVMFLLARRLRGSDDVPLVFGPWLLYDIVRTARRSRLFLIRSAVLAALLVALLLIHQSWWQETNVGRPRPSYSTDLFSPLPVEHGRLPILAKNVFWTLLIVQLAAVFVLTPIFTAGALAEERRRGSLDLFFTTDLRNHEIVFGCLVARVSTILLLVLAGLPVFSFLQFLGGIDPSWVFLGFLGTIACALICGACGIYAETIAPTQANALLLAYILTFGVLYGSVYIFIFGAIVDFPSLLLMCLIYVLGAVGILLIQATKGIRSNVQPQEARQMPVANRVLTPDIADPRVQLHDPRQVLAAHRDAPKPELAKLAQGSEVIFWKDRSWVFSPVSLTVIRRVGIPLLCAPFMCSYVLISEFHIPSLLILVNAMSCLFASMVSLGLFVSVGVCAAGRFSRERELRTLDNLLATSLTRLEIYGGKWRASILSYHPIAWLIPVIAWLYASVVGASVQFLPFVLILLVVHAAFSASLGLYCSAVCRTTVRASIWTASLVLLFQVVPLLFPGAEILSPMAALIQLCVIPGIPALRSPGPVSFFVLMFGELSALILAAALLAGLTCRRLSTNG